METHREPSFDLSAQSSDHLTGYNFAALQEADKAPGRDA